MLPAPEKHIAIPVPPAKGGLSSRRLKRQKEPIG